MCFLYICLCVCVCGILSLLLFLCALEAHFLLSPFRDFSDFREFHPTKKKRRKHEQKCLQRVHEEINARNHILCMVHFYTLVNFLSFSIIFSGLGQVFFWGSSPCIIHKVSRPAWTPIAFTISTIITIQIPVNWTGNKTWIGHRDPDIK